MPRKTNTLEYGVRHPPAPGVSDHIEYVTVSDAYDAYMSPKQFAEVRAKAVGGKVVVRTLTIEASDWTEVTQ
jgi:hypothetical protein